MKFYPGQALLLSKLRFLRPRIGRGEYLAQPRNFDRFRPQTRPLRAPKQASPFPRPRIIRVRRQIVSAVRPRQQTRSQSVRIRGRAATLTIRGQVLPTNIQRPQSRLFQVPELVMNRACPRINLGNAKSNHQIRLALWLYIRFPVRIQVIPVHVHF